jgi:hypothetical protein
MRTIYTLGDWVVEYRQNGWYFTTYRDRRDGRSYKGPYKSVMSVTLTIARMMRREIEARRNTSHAA